MNNRIRHKGVDIFSGAGGMSLGAIAAGIDIILAIDNDKSSAKTYIKNHPDTKFICSDIRNLDPMDHLKKSDDIFIVFGGPPCQGFSTSNTKTRNNKNPNNHLFREFARFVELINPIWFVFENVEGITDYNGGQAVSEIKATFENLGYITTEKVLTASDYGVPQHRNRFFMIGNRLGINFQFPEKPDTTVITVDEAISDLPDVENGDTRNQIPYKRIPKVSDYALKMRGDSLYSTQNFVSRNTEYVLERYRYIGQGENWRAIPDHLMTNYKNLNNSHSGIYKRLDASRPSVVISNYRKNMLIHPHCDRGLSVREAARLQSFPDTFTFEGTLMHIQQQIGNAVPPLLAEAIFTKILKTHTKCNEL